MDPQPPPVRLRNPTQGKTALVQWGLWVLMLVGGAALLFVRVLVQE